MAQPGSGGGGFVQGQPGNFGGQGQMGGQMGGGAGYGQPPIDLNNPMFQMAATSGQQFFDNGAAALQAGGPATAQPPAAPPKPWRDRAPSLCAVENSQDAAAGSSHSRVRGAEQRWAVRVDGAAQALLLSRHLVRRRQGPPLRSRAKRDKLSPTLALHCMRTCVRALKPVCPRRATAEDPAAPVPPQVVDALKRRVEQRAGVRRAAQRPQLPRPLHPHDGVRDLHRPLRAPPGLPRTEREAVRSGRKRRS